MIKFDSTHGKYKGNISYEDNKIKINGKYVFYRFSVSSYKYLKIGRYMASIRIVIARYYSSPVMERELT